MAATSLQENVSTTPGAQDWLESARDGSTAALGQLLDLYRHDLMQLADRELSPDLRAKGSASDLVQEAFLKAQRGFSDFHGSTPAELQAWLRAILLNHVANFTRRYRLTDKRQVALEIPLHGSDVPAAPARGNGSPSDAAIDHERARLLEQAMEKLPDHYLQVVLLRHRENLSFEDIGQAIGRSAEAARKLWERAIAHLRNNLSLPDEP